MARPQPSFYTALQTFFSSRIQVRDANTAAACGTSLTASGGDYVEVAVTPEELPPELKEVLSRTLALVAGTTNTRDTHRILQDHYAKFAVYETNLLWCPHSFSIAAWLGAARRLTMPYVEGIRCHRIVLRRIPSTALPLASETAGSQTHGPLMEGSLRGVFTPAPEVVMQMQMDVAFSWRPLAPLHHLLLSWGAKGLQLPAFTTEHTITLTIDSQSRVVQHRDITHNFPAAPLLIKGLLGLPTPLVATMLHV